MTKRKIIRQGDVLFYEIEPREVDFDANQEPQKRKKYCVKTGENGHSHILVAETPFTILKTISGDVVVEIKDGKAVLTHEEHKHLEIPKGTYLIKDEREWDYAQQGWYRVRD
jgi:hypothetical protein